MSLLQALLRLLTLSRPPAKPWEVTACNRPFLAIHFDSGMSVLPSWTTSQGDWSLVLEFGGVIREGCSFLSLKVFTQARARFAAVQLLGHVCEVPGF